MAVLKMAVATTVSNLQSAFAAHTTGAAQGSCEETAGFFALFLFVMSEVKLLLCSVLTDLCLHRAESSGGKDRL